MDYEGTEELDDEEIMAGGVKSEFKSSDCFSGRTTEEADQMGTLISAVEAHPILYSSASRGNNGQFNTTKEAAWREVAFVVGMEVQWCAKKWKSLRDMFVKKVNSLRGKNASMRKRIQSWVYFSSLTFLLAHIHHQSTKTRNRLARLNHIEVDHTNSMEHLLIPHMVSTDYLEVDIQEESPSSTPNGNSLRTNNGFSSPTSSPTPSRINDDACRQELWRSEKKLDAHDYFCMSLAQQMRGFSATNAAEARMKISQIMFEFETRRAAE